MRTRHERLLSYASRLAMPATGIESTFTATELAGVAVNARVLAERCRHRIDELERGLPPPAPASRRGRLASEIERLSFARVAMEEAAAAAELHERGDLDDTTRRALRTAAAVTYARPFTDSANFGRLSTKRRPPPGDDRRLHNRLLLLRDALYAHTDRLYRAVAAPGQIPGLDEWRVLIADEGLDMAAVAKLAHAQAQRFREAIAELDEAWRAS
jgi:hypothetical protein